MTAEWLETDGLGGYAMGMADGIRTRRYHGVLIAAARPPGGRMMMVADLEVYAGEHALSSHRYAGDVVHPDGASRIVSFTTVPWPTWEYALPGGARVKQELVMTASGTTLRWTSPVPLRVRPMYAVRDHHGMQHENGAFRFEPWIKGEHFVWHAYDGCPPIVATTSGKYRHAPEWYRRFRYSEEVARGLDAEEDLASPGEWTFASNGRIDFGISVDAAPADLEAEARRRRSFASPLARAADQYLVKRGEGCTVIAGYPWFTDWGRDTFISLRGLCLANGRVDDARKIVLAWCTSALSEGMLPNRFLDSGEAPEYNSVDASLWFVVAADALLAVGGVSPDEKKTIEHAIDEIVAGYARGTRHRIGATDDGLLAAGVPGLQLTWMDAKVGDWVVTPRIGKPVEVQALWVNALEIAGRRTLRWLELAKRARASFAARFWNAERGMLYDVVDVDHEHGRVDPSFRPNQIFAIGGLPSPLLDGDRARAVVDAVERLWTPAGLRSLAPGEPGYRGWYGGGPVERDGAYHQGVVWTWLAGPFLEAWVRVHGAAGAREKFLAPLLARAGESGQLAELAQQEPPYVSTGAPFQAWSVAEALRLDAMLP